MERKPIFNDFHEDEDQEDDDNEEQPRKKRSEFLRRWHELLSGNREKSSETEDDEETEEDDDNIPSWRRVFRRFFKKNVALDSVEHTDQGTRQTGTAEQTTAEDHLPHQELTTDRLESAEAVEFPNQEEDVSVVIEEDRVEVDYQERDDGTEEVIITEENTEETIVFHSPERSIDDEVRDQASDLEVGDTQEPNQELEVEHIVPELDNTDALNASQEQAFIQNNEPSVGVSSHEQGGGASATPVGVLAADRLRDSKDKKLRRQAKKYKKEVAEQQKRQDKDIKANKKQHHEALDQKDQEIDSLRQRVARIEESATVRPPANPSELRRNQSVSPPLEKIQKSNFETHEVSERYPATTSSSERVTHGITRHEQTPRAQQKEAESYSRAASEETLYAPRGPEKFNSSPYYEQPDKRPEQEKPLDQQPNSVEPIYERVTIHESEYDRRHEIKDEPVKSRNRPPQPDFTEEASNSTTSVHHNNANNSSVHSSASHGGKQNTNTANQDDSTSEMYKTAIVSGIVTGAVLLAVVILIVILR